MRSSASHAFRRFRLGTLRYRSRSRTGSIGYAGGMIEVTPRDNGRSAWCWGRSLGVACHCGHRVPVELGSRNITAGDMRRLHDLHFVCSRCGSDKVSLWLFRSDEDVAAFRDHGAPVRLPADSTEAKVPPTVPRVPAGRIDEPIPNFAPRGWVMTDDGRNWVAIVDADRARDRAEPGLVGPVLIAGKGYDCIAVEATRLAKPKIHFGEPIGLLVTMPGDTFALSGP